jgi:HKD family nuclease
VKLEIIENNGPDNLRDTLKDCLGRFSEISIAVAFVTQSVLDEILQPLQQAASQTLLDEAKAITLSHPLSA